MDRTDFHLSRRDVMVAAAAAAAAAAVPLRPARAAAKYTRPNVTSAAGQKMLAIYARGVEAMLKLPPDNPHNWFRNAFVHFMDCPHGNWWFYVWHRGYIGYFEQTIRTVTGEASFALPYWDWTQLPRIPNEMFDGALAPTGMAFEPYTGNLALFSALMQPALTTYWGTLTAGQLDQLKKRGYTSLDGIWNDVIGGAMVGDPPELVGIAGNQAFTNTCGARYLSRDNPDLDKDTAYDVSPPMVRGGLHPQEFNREQAQLSFTSAKTTSHNVPPAGRQVFSILEGFPHNKVHNYIGGVGPLQLGPYGVMANNLSPIDPIFFLHHGNMDRLWDVWSRKQKAMGFSDRPSAADAPTFFAEPFLFFIDGSGKPITDGKAEMYFDMAVFDYDYEPGFGEDVIPQTGATVTAGAPQVIQGAVAANIGKVVVPLAAVRSHLAAAAAERPLIVEITVARPPGVDGAREFDILVNAPEGVTEVSADSPYYAGTFALFGAPMPGMHRHGDLAFAVPLPKTLRAFTELGAATEATLNIRVVPSDGQTKKAPVVLKAVSVAAQ
ncbi:tyrosinase family protein [Mycobacterium sp. KBS0706]|uniref:tyrosinase family protein n=1 Tax=Mycobacterium sp. KBS0706 TaxID=2578109 RepID=UPI001C8F80A1|nr:tyrosinase family protein [Mycobacterium sp. KBS0706]